MDFLKQRLISGAFLGMAISSRFLLNFQTGILSNILSFVLLFSLFSAMIYWLKKYRDTLPEKKLSLKLLQSFTFQLFIIASIFSSIVKYVFFTYLKPLEFKMIVSQTMNFMTQEAIYPKEMLQQSAAFLTPMNFAFVSALMNLFFGMIMGFILWPLFKKEQEFLSSKK